MIEIETVAVLGADRDAVRLALLCSLGGCHVRVRAEEAESLAGAFADLRAAVDAASASGSIGPEDRQRILDGILFTHDFDEAVTGADLAIASGRLDPAAARALLARLAASCRATALLATPLPPEEVAAPLAQPGRVLSATLVVDGAPLPGLVLRAGPTTTAYARECAEGFASRLARASSPRG